MKSIIINRMYAGEYLTKEIGGGEVINLLHADDQKNYCFINPIGMINPEYDDSVCAVVHTRLYEAGCFEVLGVSIIGKSGQLFHPKGYSKKDRVASAVNQLRAYERNNPITYGGLPYVMTNESWPTVSFVSEKLLRPKTLIYIIDSAYDKSINQELTICKMSDKRFARQSLIMYVDDLKNPKSYSSFVDMINNDELWYEKTITVHDGMKEHNRFNFLTLINKEDDELAFSNMFNHFFTNHPKLFKDFAHTVMNLKISEEFSIKREFHNIDLWVEDEESILVIENKIKSGINGVSIRHDFSEDGLVQSQLSKYYEFAIKEGEKHNKKVYLYIFVPNYNKLDLSSYSGSKHYKVIRYKEIHDFLTTKTVKDAYYNDFCNALYKHTKDIPIDYSKILMNYLIKQIQKHAK